MKNILVINVNWLGDVIFSAPIFKALKAAYPQARIACLAVPRVRQVLESISCIDEIIEYDEKGRHSTPWGKFKLIIQLRRNKFDSAFILHKSLTRALLAFLAGIPVRVGYKTKGRGFLLTHTIPDQVDSLHRSDYYLKVLERYGIPIGDRSCQLNVSPDAEAEVRKILAQEGIGNEGFAVIHPGANWDLKRWPVEKFALLTDSLISNLKTKVVITGAENDLSLVSQIAQLCKTKPVLLTGKVNLKQLMALMKMSAFVLSADSGPIHVASGVGANVIGLFGPTRPEITAPRGKGRIALIQHDVGCNRRPCYYLQCPDNICMQSITVDDVLQEIKKLRP